MEVPMAIIIEIEKNIELIEKRNYNLRGKLWFRYEKYFFFNTILLSSWHSLVLFKQIEKKNQFWDWLSSKSWIYFVHTEKKFKEYECITKSAL